MSVNYAKFQEKCLIVEQFQGNYLKEIKQSVTLRCYVICQLGVRSTSFLAVALGQITFKASCNQDEKVAALVADLPRQF